MTSQNEIDSFPINYPDCTEIEGYLNIYGDSIVNLNGLSQLTSIGIGINIGSLNEELLIEDLSGLNNISTVGLNITIENCSQLTSLNGLDSISNVNFIRIDNCSLIEDLNGLYSVSIINKIVIVNCPQLMSLNGFNTNIDLNIISITNCPLLENMSGLDSISIIGSIYLTDCPQLTSLNGLEVLTSLGVFGIEDCPSLTSLNSLSGITELNSLAILNCNQLTTIDAFHQVSELSSGLLLRSNASLTSIEGLSNIESIRNFRIDDNAVLSNFNDLESLVSISGESPYPGSISIENNSTLTSLAFPNEIQTQAVLELSISNNPLLEDLAGLSFIDTIYNNCEIIDNPSLQDLSGLDNLSYSTDLIIKDNSSLQNISNLSSLSRLHGYLWIKNNQSLINLNGLQNLEAVEGYTSYWLCVVIDSNSSLLSLYGLNNLAYLGNGVRVENNESLLTIEALSSITSTYFVGFLIVNGNNSLISLNGLENFPINHLNIIEIENNSSLTYCAVQSVCNYLDGEGYSEFAFISNNALACNSVEEVEDDCENGEPCFVGEIELNSQIEVDEFSINYPNCNIVFGDLIIEGDDIENLDGLSQLAQINGSLYIGNTNGNPVLTDLSGLSNISSINGIIWIVFNEELEDLFGLHNIAASSIESIEVSDNSSLSNCAIQNFCDFISQDDPEAVFSFNDNGCNSIDQVQNTCITGIDEQDLNSLITIYPNPTKNILNIEVNTSAELRTIKIFNQFGVLVYSGIYSNSINVSQLPEGLYILKLDGPSIQIRENFFKA